MAPVDWDDITNANIQELEDDAAERMYEGLAEVGNYSNQILLHLIHVMYT